MIDLDLMAPSPPRGYVYWAQRFRREFIWAYQGIPRIRRRSSFNCHDGIVWRILRGEATIKRSESTIAVGPGYWISPRMPFEWEFSDDAEIISICFCCEWPTGQPLLPSGFRIKMLAKDNPELDISAQRLIECQPETVSSDFFNLNDAQIDFTTFAQIDMAFSTWLSAWIHALQANGINLTKVSGVRPEVEKASDYIERLAQGKSDFDENEIACLVGLSRSHLHALYTETFSMTPREHYDRLKLETAQALLNRECCRIKALAFDLGFNSESHFSNWFRRRSGVSPREYRRMGRIAG